MSGGDIVEELGAVVNGVGSSASAAEAISSGAKPHRARQGYAGDIREIGYQCCER